MEREKWRVCLGGRVRWCESFRPRMVAFYRPERWASRVVWGGGASQSRVKRRKGEGAGGLSRAPGSLERLQAHQDKASAGFQRGAR
jgi:hypothetical protein